MSKNSKSVFDQMQDLGLCSAYHFYKKHHHCHFCRSEHVNDHSIEVFISLGISVSIIVQGKCEVTRPRDIETCQHSLMRFSCIYAGVSMY